MATKRIKDITNTATTFASDDFIALDGSTQGTRKMDKDDLISQVSAGVSGDYLEEANNLSDVASKDTSKLNLEVPDVGTAPNEVPLNGQLGSMAYQSSDSVSVDTLEVTDKVDGTLNVESTDGLVASFERTGNAKLKVHADSSGPYFDTETGHNLRIFTNGGEAVRVNGSGQVGIGTPSPDSTLEVTGASATSNNGATVLVTDSASVAADIGGTIALRGTDGTTDRTLALVKGGKVDGTSAFDGYLSLQTRSNGAANTTEAIHIDSSQRVGIGTASPGSYDGNADDLVVATNGNTGISIRTSSTGSGAIYFAEGTSGTERYKAYLAYSQNTDTMSFGTGAVTQWQIDSSGNLVAYSAGNGIDFGSGASTTLSDYERGFHNATLTTETSGTISVSSGSDRLEYTRVGDLVTIAGKISTVSVSSPVGNYVKLSLPFTIANLTESAGHSAGSCVIFNAAGNMGDYSLTGLEGDAFARIYKNTSTVASATAPDFSGDEIIYVNFSYHTS